MPEFVEITHTFSNPCKKKEKFNVTNVRELHLHVQQKYF